MTIKARKWQHNKFEYGEWCELCDGDWPCQAERMRLRAETAEEMLEGLTAANLAAGDEARRANRAEARAERAEAALLTASLWAHAYVAGSDNICVTCGGIGSYSHTEPEVVTELRAKQIRRARI